ncbi:MAG TPA: LysR family transcriptional regulator [Thermoanaerobaculia bacterium]|nr:LysR family transcriptional regulator [Thermoanaerobaculia bacterium]
MTRVRKPSGRDVGETACSRVVARIRILAGETIVLGPGKTDLLEAVREFGTIGEAAVSLDMSYMRALQLIRIMNAAFREPLVISVRGGSSRGGAALTPLGERVVELYRRMERKALKSVAAEAKAIDKLLK